MSSAAALASSAAKPFYAIPGPTRYPLVGNLFQYVFGPFDRSQYHEALRTMHAQFGPIVRQNIGGRDIVHVFEPEDIKTVYAHESKWPQVPPLQETTQLYRAQKQMSLGLGNTNGEEWYRLRTNSQQRMLRPKEVQQHLPGVNAIASDFASRLARLRYVNCEVNDLRAEVGRWSLENAGSLVFDHRLGLFDENNAQAERFGAAMVEANAQIFKYSGILKLSFPFYRFVTTPKWRALIKAEDFFYSNAIRLVDEAILRLRDAMEAEGGLHPDRFYFLSYLVSKKELSLKDVTIICLSLFSDGLSTTTPTVLFNLYALAVNPLQQQKVYEEVKKVVGSAPEITQDHINKLPYLKAFVKETFRLWPNGTEVSRYTEEDMVLSGFHIPKGTYVDLNPFVRFRDPALFSDADVHRPERWLRADGSVSESEATTAAAESSETTKVHPYLLTPFGHGTRMCAGRRFAEQDLYVLLATLLRKFRLEYPAGETMGQVYNTLLFPDRPVRVKFQDRN